ncbi:MAG: thiamine phosphate synthase [Alphaproteobacteria bacterium GM202ARS2]|nr:thiamine phosphate synthase [Alphaproteobacteria bacterium GM202ARS2]
MRLPVMRLYVLTPPQWDDWHHEQLAMMLRAVRRGCIAYVQWRQKDASNDTQGQARQLKRLRHLCDEWGVRLIINDRQAGVGEDGVHIGKDDGTPSMVRRRMGAHALLGVSCYGSLRQGLVTQRSGADYVAFGCLFPTTSKTRVMPARLRLLHQWQRIGRIPVVAIGGIGLQHLRILRRCGADYVAMLSAIWHHPRGCVYAVQQFQRMMPMRTQPRYKLTGRAG